MSVQRVKQAAVVAATVLAFTAFGLGDAHAQSFHVNNFSCSSTPFGVDVDVGGVGNTDLCVIGSASINLNCACAGGGGNCTSDAKKNTSTATASTSADLQPRNGQVSATVTIPFSTSDSQCSALACPSGQKAKLVEFAASETFRLCISNGAPSCGCAQDTHQLDETITCLSSGTPFPGKKNSCLSLFPS